MFCSHNGAFYELFRFQTRLPCPELVCAVGDDVTVKQRYYQSPVSGPRFASDLQHLSGSDDASTQYRVNHSDVTVKQRCYQSPVSGPRFASDL